MTRRPRLLLALAGLGLLSASSISAAQVGPDVIVGDLPNMQYFGASGGIAAYSIATTSCNVGTAQLNWIQSTNQHPVIAQNLYRIKDGRLEQIGMSWLKHGFCALQQTICGPCQPAGGGCASRLGVGCSDPYSSGLNGEQSNLGPRSQVNPWTGQFPFPFSAPSAPATIGRRLQVPTGDVTPAQNPGAIYLMEGQYGARDDADAGNQNNNASYRRVNINGPSSFSYPAATVRHKPAIMGRGDLDPTVTVVAATVPGEGRLHVAGKTIDNGDGTWTYNYAVHNLNSHIGVSALSIPLNCGAVASDMYFRAPISHSGEPYSNAPWSMEVRSGDAIVWETESFEANSNANAIRWATTYTFAFTSTSAPSTGRVTLGLFRSGEALEVAGLPVPGAACRADWDADSNVNSGDISSYLTAWLDSVNDGTTAADYDCDGAVNSGDISAFLTSWLAALTGGC